MKEEVARISEKRGCGARVVMQEAKGQGAVWIWGRMGSGKRGVWDRTAARASPGDRPGASRLPDAPA